MLISVSQNQIGFNELLILPSLMIMKQYGELKLTDTARSTERANPGEKGLKAANTGQTR